MTLLGLLLTLVAVVVLPGLAGGLTVGLAFGRVTTRDGGSPPEVVVAACLAAGLAAWLLTAGLLVRTVGITATSTRTAAVVVAVASVGVLVLPNVRRAWGVLIPAVRWAGAAALLALLAWAPVGFLMWGTDSGTVASTPWYYWGLASQLAEAGTFPAASVEFATQVPYLADYPLYTGAEAMLMTGLAEGAQPAVLNLMTMVAVITLGTGAALLARTWGATPTASLVAAPLAVATGVGVLRLLGSRPEGFALGLSLLVVVLVVDWLRSRDVASLWWGSVLAAVVAQVHGIAFVVTGLLLVAAAVTLWTQRRSWGLVATAAGTALGMLGVVAALGLAMGRVSGSSTSAGIADVAGGQDPTWVFRQLVRAREPGPPPSRLDLLEYGFERLYDPWTVPVAVLMATLVVALLVRARTDRGALPHAVFFTTALSLLVSVTCVFVFGWDSYVPRRTGSERILLEATLLPPVLMAGATSVAASALRGGRGRALSMGMVALALAVGLVSSVQRTQDAADWRPTSADREALESLDIPADAVVLANAYTEGYLRHATGARPLLEGRAPYTFPDQLSRAVDLLQGAREFYRDPSGGLDFLDEQDVEYVVVARPGSFAITSEHLLDDGTGLARLRAVPQLEEVLSSEGLVVFRYVPRDPDR